MGQENVEASNEITKEAEKMFAIKAAIVYFIIFLVFNGWLLPLM